jgi:branched-chain amino acid aminotransferase
MKAEFIWMDGEIVPYQQARVHVLTPTLHYGLGAFEGIRAYQTPSGPGIFRLPEHLIRFLESAHIAGVRDFPYTSEELRAATLETIRANQLESCYIRPLLYMSGPLGINPDTWTPRVSIAAWEWGPYLGEEASLTGIHLMTSSFTRHHVNITMTKAKISGNYINSAYAKSLAVRSGFDEAVLLDPEGYVAECSGENIFLVKNGVLYTPPPAAVLEGITRDSLITLAEDLEIETRESPLTRDQFYAADEVFICGTAAEVVPVREMDHRLIAGGQRGPITEQLQDLYHKTAAGQGPRSQEWLTIVQ